MEPDLSNLAASSITSPPLSEGRTEGMFLTDAEIEEAPSSKVLEDTAVTMEQTIPKDLKEAYNNSFVSLPKPEILNTTSQRKLLDHAEFVKHVSKNMIQDGEQDAEATLASQILAEDQIFLDHIRKQYNLYLAPGAIHQAQTDQNAPTIDAEIENKLDQKRIQNAFTIVKHIAMKALVQI